MGCLLTESSSHLIAKQQLCNELLLVQWCTRQLHVATVAVVELLRRATRTQGHLLKCPSLGHKDYQNTRTWNIRGQTCHVGPGPQLAERELTSACVSWTPNPRMNWSNPMCVQMQVAFTTQCGVTCCTVTVLRGKPRSLRNLIKNAYQMSHQGTDARMRPGRMHDHDMIWNKTGNHACATVHVTCTAGCWLHAVEVSAMRPTCLATIVRSASSLGARHSYYGSLA